MEADDNFVESIESLEDHKQYNNHLRYEEMMNSALKNQSSLIEANPILPSGRYTDHRGEDALICYHASSLRQVPGGDSKERRPKLPKIKLNSSCNSQYGSFSIQQLDQKQQTRKLFFGDSTQQNHPYTDRVQYLINNPGAELNGWQQNTHSNWVQAFSVIQDDRPKIKGYLRATNNKRISTYEATITNFTKAKTPTTAQLLLPHEFMRLMNQSQTLIYQRVDNSRLNTCDKSGKCHYSSLFFDVRDLEKNSHDRQTLNLYQELQRKYPYSSVISTFRHLSNPIQFNSQFQGGNLFSALKKSEKEYDLFLQNDTNTKGSTQWFYFSVTTQQKIKIKFNILNFYKESSLFNKGMKPLVYSVQRYKKTKEDWRRTGINIIYEEGFSNQDRTYYQLSFTYDFEYCDDTVYFAYSFPYGYSDLKNYLQIQTSNPNNASYLRQTTICKTLLNLNLFQLEITNNIAKLKQQNSKNNQSLGTTSSGSKKREIIYILARQHSGESPASYVLQGIVNTLLADRIESDALRDKFIFKIIPMVNPDGVVSGNYRTNLSGNDVNRKWDFPSKVLHPEIYALRKRIHEDKRDIKFFLDLHGHSRKMNSFFYGSPLQKEEHKLYPFVCSRINKDISYEDCSYKIDESKRSTARVVCQSDFQIKKSYTFETSFYGRLKDGKRQHFQKSDLRTLGETLVLGLFYTEIKLKNLEGNQTIEGTAIAQTQGARIQKSPLKKASYTPQSKQHNTTHGSNKYIEIINTFAKDLQQKWKKEARKSTKYQGDAESAGSDSDPEQGQLKEQEIDILKQLRCQQLTKYQQSQSEQLKQGQQGPDDEKQYDSPGRRNSTKSPNSSLKNYKQSSLKRRLSRKLIEQIANGDDDNNPADSGTQEPVRVERIYMTLGQTNKNYRYDVLDLKRTLKYMMDGKIATETSGAPNVHARSVVKYEKRILQEDDEQERQGRDSSGRIDIRDDRGGIIRRQGPFLRHRVNRMKRVSNNSYVAGNTNTNNNT